MVPKDHCRERDSGRVVHSLPCNQFNQSMESINVSWRMGGMLLGEPTMFVCGMEIIIWGGRCGL